MAGDSLQDQSFISHPVEPIALPISDERAAARRGPGPGGLLESSSLADALDRLIRLMEFQLPDMRGSVLLLDDDGMTLHHGAAPHLPVAYCRAIDGSRIGPSAGSCGTAAYRGAQVVVHDIATDPLWADYRQVALPHGLRACWSTPIRGEGRVLGTFAMYYDEPRTPTTSELGLAGIASLLASNIIVRARAEAALRTSEAELRERTAAAEQLARELAESEARMRAARAEAEHANRVKADFLAKMSHELRTPLNAIGGYATLMLDGIPVPATEPHRRFLQRILEAQKHLMGLIEAVLTHAKLEAGRMTYRIERIGVGELLQATESITAPLLAAKHIEYDCSACEARLALRADRQKTVQILLNLVSNAVKFTPAQGRVALRTTGPGPGFIGIGVSDNGVGMTTEQVAVVFEPFVQLDNAPGEAKGTGLGLPISRELARGMGGDLTATSEPGKGTEFLLTLPEDRRVAELAGIG